MIVQTLSPAVRSGAVLAAVIGALTVTGCAGTDASADSAEPVEYADGTYTAEGSYQTPENVERVSVTLTIADNLVAGVEVAGDPGARETEQYQAAFISGIATEIVGVPLDEIDVSRVAGSSLTSGGFNAAVAEIKAQAALEQ
ncbi:hypothetical protein [uncultured Microbacterium sp.]|uniref:FMN-binding protein n=1 Tax=uncultured Microbacterium sp. TaxID=191216 RepID=UPI0026107E85|nr:hypothetical protein [uncultured Microbacterium sp.]